jgi:nucleoside-diphosphate-sugar epimerase
MIACTGSRGFLGKNLLDRLKNVKEFNRGDELLLDGVDTVIHLACDADSRNSNKNLPNSVHDNTGVFVDVLAEALHCGVKRFIYISSIEAEDEKNVYGICKRANEKILQVSGIPYVIIRPCNLYGKYMDLHDEKRNVVANFMRSLKEHKPLNIIGDGSKSYPFTFVKPVVDTIIESLTQYTNQTLTVGSSLYISINQLANLLEGITTTWDWVKKEKV